MRRTLCRIGEKQRNNAVNFTAWTNELLNSDGCFLRGIMYETILILFSKQNNVFFFSLNKLKL